MRKRRSSWKWRKRRDRGRRERIGRRVEDMAHVTMVVIAIAIVSVIVDDE